jgi:hypothetical protein
VNEERVWTYLVQVNKVADAEEVALNCDVTEEFAQQCIDRIGTPREVLLAERDTLMEGRKDDGDKAPYHLLAPEMLEATALVLGFGAKKYSARNWEKGMSWSRPFGALMRHMWAWWRGEACDPETGYSHLWHASCCLMFLVAYEARSCGADDRPEPSEEKSK